MAPAEVEEAAALGLSSPQDMLAGSVAGVAILLVGHPFDTIKVRLQTQSAKGLSRFRGGFHCFTWTVQREGVFALYKGMGSPMSMVPAINAISFSSFEKAKAELLRHSGNSELTSSEAAIAGGWAGLISSAIASPVELVRNRLQIQYNVAGDMAGLAYAGPIDCVRKIMQTSGIRGLYKGYVATILREVPAYAAQFYTYETLKRTMSSPSMPGEDLPAWKLILAGGISGLACWVCSYPQDLVKSLIQTKPDGTYAKSRMFPDGGFINASSQIFRDFGLRGFWTGFGPCAARAFPANAAGFLAYEMAGSFLKKR